MGIASETTKNFPEPEIIAHCLYEMTFIGFEEEEIREQFRLLKDRVEEFNNEIDLAMTDSREDNVVKATELRKKWR